MIRPAVVEDVPALARVQVRAWLHAYSDFMDPDEIAARPVEVREPQWRAALTDPSSPATTVVFDQDGAVAGFATTGPARDDDLDPGTGELYAIYVDPPAQGAGVGRALHAEAVRRLAAAGFGRATLWTFAANEQAIAFYERLGWRPDPASPAQGWVGCDRAAPSMRYVRDLP